MSEQEQEQTQEPAEPAPDAPVEDAPHGDDDFEAEQEESEDIEGRPGEPAPEEAAEPQALSQKQLEKALDKLDREAERHNKRVVEIMGDDVEMLLDCPLCDPLTPGKIMPSPATPERFPAVREFMGDTQPANYQQDPNTHMCVTCGGEGVVETGSRVESQRLLACTDCGGKGWQGARAPMVAGVAATAAQLAEANGPVEMRAVTSEPPEAARLRALGYTLIDPVRS